jgi:hypothetical protein
VKLESRPSPADYSPTIDSQTKVSPRAFLIGSPPSVRADGVPLGVAFTDHLGQAVEKRKLDDSSRRDKPLGPGEYDACK